MPVDPDTQAPPPVDPYLPPVSPTSGTLSTAPTPTASTAPNLALGPSVAPPPAPPPAATTPPAAAPGAAITPPDARPTVTPEQQQLYADLTKQLTGAQSPTLDQATYKPPNKTGTIIASLLSVLFPGAGIARVASGYLKGSDERAKSEYDRAQAQNQSKYNAGEQQLTDLEKRQQAAASIVDTQTKAAEAYDYHQGVLADQAARLQETHDHNVATVQSAAGRLQQGWDRLGISHANLARLTTKDQNQVALALTHDAITQDQGNRRMAQAAQIAAMNELGRNTRFTQDQSFINARSKVMAADRAVQTMITAEMNPLSTDTPEMKQQKVQALLDSFDKTYDASITPLSAKHPELANIADTLTGSAYGTDDYTNAPPGTPGSGAPSPSAIYHANGGTGGDPNRPVAQSTFGPPPGAKATPPPVSLTTPLAQLWIRAGGDPKDAQTMAIVAANESAGNRYAVNPKGTGVGLWQINPEAHGSGNWTDPLTNARKAVELFKQSGLNPWLDSASQGAYGGWQSTINPRPGQPGTSPGADLTAYLAPPKPPVTPGAQPPKTDATHPAPPPPMSPQQKFEKALENGVAIVTADPSKFNDIEKQISDSVAHKEITPQQGQMALQKLQEAVKKKGGDSARAAAAAAAGLQPGTPAYAHFMSTAQPGQFATPAQLAPPPAAPPAPPQTPGTSPQERAAQGLPAMPAGSPTTVGAQQAAYAAQMLQRVRAMPPAQQAAFIAKQPPQLQAFLRAQLAKAA